MSLALRPRLRRGFTLIEVLISLVIIGTLSGTMMVTMGSGSDKARATRVVSDMKTLSRAAQMAYADGLSLGADVTELSPYISGTLDNEGTYTLQAQDGYLFVKADLDNYGDGVRSRLAARADEWNLWQDIGGDDPDTYNEATAAFLPVNLMASDVEEAEGLFVLDFTSLSGTSLFDYGVGDNSSVSAWKITQDGLLSNAGDSSFDDSFLIAGQSWENCTITATATFIQEDGSIEGYGIYYLTTYDLDDAGYADITGGYRIQFDPGLNNSLVLRDYNDSLLTQVSMSSFIPDGTTVDEYLDSSHEIEISVADGNHVISIDGTVALEYYDDTYTSGTVGFRDWGDGQTQFSSIEVISNE